MSGISRGLSALEIRKIWQLAKLATLEFTDFMNIQENSSEMSEVTLWRGDFR